MVYEKYAGQQKKIKAFDAILLKADVANMRFMLILFFLLIRNYSIL